MANTKTRLLGRTALFAAGFVSHGHTGSGTLTEGFGGIMMGALVGAFVGLVAGLIASHMVRYCYFLMGRHLNGSWITVCVALLSAALFAWMAATSGQEETTSTEGLVKD